MDYGSPLECRSLGRIFLTVRPIEPARSIIDIAFADRLEEACRALPLLALKGGKSIGKSRTEVDIVGPRAIVPSENLEDRRWIGLAPQPEQAQRPE